MHIMKLFENVVVKKLINYRDIEIDSITADSREVGENSLYICLIGERANGHDHITEAISRGAVALVTTCEIDSDLPQFVVENTRSALALIAANYYDHPAERMKIVTIVGTNGKTSTADILSEIFLTAGYRVATIGTLGYKIGRDRSPGTLTTPDPIDLNKNLADMVRQGVEYVFLEASAHAIHYDKLAGIRAKATVFTNLTQDHLDFFGTMEKYAYTKMSYFSPENTALAIVNSDDEYGRRIICDHKVPIITYGIENPADVFAIDVAENESGVSFTVNAFDQIERISTPLHGRFNVYNVMGAISVSMYFGINLYTVAKALEHIPLVPGRYQVYNVHGRQVVVDFAHTPDGLMNLLSGIRERTAGRIVTVFGCGGDRDRVKRPIMGAIAAKYSDSVIITDDNPRWEDEFLIATEIKSGIPSDTSCEIILDREKAIRLALEVASEGDTVVIAGKGHENYIEIKGQRYPYNDVEVLQKLSR